MFVFLLHGFHNWYFRRWVTRTGSWPWCCEGRASRGTWRHTGCWPNSSPRRWRTCIQTPSSLSFQTRKAVQFSITVADCCYAAQVTAAAIFTQDDLLIDLMYCLLSCHDNQINQNLDIFRKVSVILTWSSDQATVVYSGIWKGCHFPAWLDPQRRGEGHLLHSPLHGQVRDCGPELVSPARGDDHHHGGYCQGEALVCL